MFSKCSDSREFNFINNLLCTALSDSFLFCDRKWGYQYKLIYIFSFMTLKCNLGGS